MKEFEVLPIGSFAIFVNTRALWNEFPILEVREAIAEAIIDHLQAKLRELPDGDQIVVTQVTTTVGCIVITISLGTLLKGLAAGGGAKLAYNLVKDYDKLIGNSQRIVADMKNIYLKLTRKKGAEQIIPQIEVLTELPPELIAVHQNGGAAIANGEEIRIAKIAVMRDDLLRCLEIDNLHLKIELHQRYNKHLNLQQHDRPADQGPTSC